MDKLLIIGASGHGKVAADIAHKMNKWNTISFLDDDENLKSSMGNDVIGKAAEVTTYINDYDIFVGIGNNAIREKIQTELEEMGASITSLFHPKAIIGNQVIFGRGSIVMAGAIINCCSKIGNGCIINTSATVDHDNNIEDYVHISPGCHIAGSVTVKKRSWLGIGSIVINNLSITEATVIGAGAVVTKDITKSGVYIGVPARRMQE